MEFIGGLVKDSSLSGNSVERVQWENSNSSVAFPFADDSLPAGFPVDAVVDACVVVPSTVEQSVAEVTLQSLHISEHMVSAMVCVGGAPALSCMVLKSVFEPFRPMKMESVDGSCSGTITFGDIDFSAYRMPYTFRTPVPMSESAVCRPIVGRLRKFFKAATGREATGDVGIVLPPEVKMQVENGEAPEGFRDLDNRSTIYFSAALANKSIVEHPCVNNTTLVPITSINGVFPNKSGDIAIVFGEG